MLTLIWEGQVTFAGKWVGPPQAGTACDSCRPEYRQWKPPAAGHGGPTLPLSVGQG